MEAVRLQLRVYYKYIITLNIWAIWVCNITFEINLKHYNTMLNTILNRPGMNGLRIDIIGGIIKLNVPDAMLQANAAISTIEISK